MKVVKVGEDATVGDEVVGEDATVGDAMVGDEVVGENELMAMLDSLLVMVQLMVLVVEMISDATDEGAAVG